MKNRILSLCILLTIAISPAVIAQNVAVNDSGNSADTSAILDVNSTTKGFLMPRMTSTQQNAIILPATGLAVFNTTLNNFQVNTGTPLSPIWSALTTSVTANAWTLGGNNVTSVQNIGTSSNFDLPFITNNTQKMRLSAAGNLGIGATVTDTTNTEKLLVDAGTNSFNVISGRGSNPGYLQLNIRNINSGSSASSDVVATSDIGNETNGFVDLGINSSTYNVPGFNITGVSDAYLYSTGNDFAIGNATPLKSLKFFTGGTLTGNERMRIDSIGNVGIGVNSPSAALHLKAGTASPGTAPLKFIPGALLLTPEAGAIEFFSDKYYGSTSALARKEFTLNEIGLTSGRIPVVTTNGLLTENANFVYDNTNSRLGVRATTPTAFLHLGAGAAAAGNAPLKFTSGIHLTTTEAGAVEFDGSHLYFTATSAGTRYQLDQQTTGTNTGDVTIGTGNGLSLSGQVLSLGQASTSAIGALTSTDWNTFNNKLTTIDTGNIPNFSFKVRSRLSAGAGIGYSTGSGIISNTGVTALNGATGNITFPIGNLTEATSAVLTIAGGAGSVIGTGTSIQVKQASGAQSGFLSSADWTTFNGKGSGSVTSVATGYGLSGGSINTSGTLSADSATLSNYYVRRKDSATNGGYYPYASNPKNYLTGNQAITLTGDITGSGTGSFAATIAPNAVTYSKMQAVSGFSKLLGSSGTTTAVQEITIGTGLNLTATTLTATTQSATGAAGGDLTGTYPNPAIAGNVVSNTKLALMPALTIKGNNTGGITTAADLSVAQVNLILPVFTPTLNGSVPFSGGSAGKVLHGDGLWKDTAAANQWSITGNTGISPVTNFLGTSDNKSLRFRANNIQRMKVDSTGGVIVGQDTSFDATNPEKFIVNAGITSSVNAFLARGSINSYFQMNIKNTSNGTGATSDIVATADNGSETTNFVDLGINGSGYTGSSIETGAANDGYLISAGNDFYMVNSTPTKSMLFLTGGSGVANERMRILANGRVGMGVQDPTAPFVVKDTMEIRRIAPNTLSQLVFTNTSGSGNFRIGGDGGDLFWQGGGGQGLQMGSYWGTILMGDRQSSAYPAFAASPSGTGVLIQSQRTASVPLGVQAIASQTANLTEWRNSAGTTFSAINNTGSLGIGNSTPTEKLDVTGNIRFSNALMPNNLPGAPGNVLVSGGAGVPPTWSSGTFSSTNTGDQTITLTGGVTGSGTGSFPATVITNANLSGEVTSVGNATTVTNAAVIGKVLTGYISGPGTVSPTDNILQAIQKLNGNNATNANLTGEVTSAGNVSTITNNIVTNTKLAQMPALTIKGNNTAVAANSLDLSPAQVNLILPVFTAALNGLVPLSGGSVGKVLHGDGSWRDTSATAASVWSTTGNTGITPLTNYIGTTDAKSLRMKTAGIQGVILDSLGNVGIGVLPRFTDKTSGQNPGSIREKLLVDAGSTASNTLIGAIGDNNSFLQLNVQNTNTGNAASADIVATASNGNDTSAYVDMGINSQNYTTGSSSILNGPNTAYVYATGADFYLGNGAQNKSLILFTNTAATAANGTERMRILAGGNVGIATATPAQKLDVNGNINAQGSIYVDGVGSDNTGTLSPGLLLGGSGSGEGISSKRTASGNQNGLDFYTSFTNRMSILNGGNVGIGTSSPGAALHIVKNATNADILTLQNTSVSGFSSADFYSNTGVQSGTFGFGNASVAAFYANRDYFATYGNDFVVSRDGTNADVFVEGSNGYVGVSTTSPTSTLDINGSISYAITTKTANYTATAGDYTILYNNPSAITFTLPTAIGNAGRVYIVKKISATGLNVNITTTLSQTIDGVSGASAKVLSNQYDRLVFQTDGANWFIISN